MAKYLLIRFSSIGDIVLTSPVIRCIRQQVPGAEVHFLTKKQFRPIIAHNPYIHQKHYLEKDREALSARLAGENFDAVIDLHRSSLSATFVKAIKAPHVTFDKQNLRKWGMVNFKTRSNPCSHIVDRYMEMLDFLHVKNDGEGLDYFIGPGEEVAPENLPPAFHSGYAAIVIGAAHATKAIPSGKILEAIAAGNRPVMLLGGQEDRAKGDMIAAAANVPIINGAGKYSLNQSASLVKNAEYVVSGDTGLMHIAAAFRKKIFSVWGSTVPEFGMYPYLPQSDHYKFVSTQVSLGCRPCSKIGFEKCPKAHFRCMQDIDLSLVGK